ncbi:unannotated protein [freshwater metagenome]|uniref:Unannotated protein n=1 Tax=freshwater metagenome TaxID=449393 RepID=A0A6J7K1Y5_9ZZZZ|nr:hypothetical protein [Actinomycetota bacterium]
MTTTRRLPRRLGATLAASAAALLLTAGAASADSIAYVKDGNVWLTTTDASRQYQVTFDGGYSTVSQADSGRIAALRGDRIVTLNPDGSIVNADGSKRHDILTPHSYSMPGTQFRGPFDPAISPDGMKIAYTWYYTQLGETPNCTPSTGCQTVYGRQGTNYVSPDGRSPFDEPGWSEQTGWVGPSWVGDGGATLISDPIQVGNEDVVQHTPGDESNGIPGAISRWFFDPSAKGMADGEMTRNKEKLAYVTGPEHKELWLYRAKGGHPYVPENCYRLTDGVGRINSPSWSPDGTTLAFADDTGVNVLPLPSFASDCGTPTAEHTKRLLIPGATNPDWGPADVPPARPTPAPVPAPAPAPKPGGPGTKPTPTKNTTTTPNGAAITLTTRVRLRTALRKGLTVRVSGVKAGTVKAVALHAGRTVASGRAKVGRTGKAPVKLTFTKKARRSLAKRTTVKLALKAGKARGTVTLKR